MKFIPILFSTPMVQAILEERKTMTRREVNFPQVWPDLLEDLHAKLVVKDKEVFDLKGEHRFDLRDRFGKPGDVLWVRETWATNWELDNVSPSKLPYDAPFYYLVNSEKGGEGRMRPSIHMPKAACRIFLEVVSVRVERLQDISDQDAISEGIEVIGLNAAEVPFYKDYWGQSPGGMYPHPRNSFKSLWWKINGAESWDANPWVWVVEFKKIEKPLNFK